MLSRTLRTHNVSSQRSGDESQHWRLNGDGSLLGEKVKQKEHTKPSEGGP